MYTINHQSGLVRTIIIIIIALLILSYFGFDLERLAKNPTTQKNFNFIEKVVLSLWQNVLKKPVMFVWNIFVNYIWQPAFNNLKKISGGGNAQFDAPDTQLPMAR